MSVDNERGNMMINNLLSARTVQQIININAFVWCNQTYMLYVRKHQFCWGVQFIYAYKQ